MPLGLEINPTLAFPLTLPASYLVDFLSVDGETLSYLKTAKKKSKREARNKAERRHSQLKKRILLALALNARQGIRLRLQLDGPSYRSTPTFSTRNVSQFDRPGSIGHPNFLHLWQGKDSFIIA